MHNFCPNCGEKIDSDTKFCPSCGANIASYSSMPVIGNNQINSEETNSQLLKDGGTKKRSKIWIIIAIIAAILLVGVSCFLFIYYQQEKTDTAELNKMSKDDLAGLTIVYAHKHYLHNKTWDKIYHQALNGDVTVEHYQHYDNNGITMKATDGNTLYVINGKGVYTTDKNKKNTQAHLVISDGKRNLGKVDVSQAYREIKKDKLVGKMNQINGKQEALPNLNAKQLGVIIGYKYLRSDAKETILKLHQTGDKVFFNVADDDPTFHAMHFGADGSSYYKYKKVGNKVLVKRLDVKNAPDAADAPEVTDTLSYSELIKDYYSSSEQKEDVNDLAEELND